MATPQAILDELKQVKYPGLTRDIVSFGMVKDIEVGSMGVTVILAPTTTNPETLEQLRTAVHTVVASLPDIGNVEVRIESAAPAQRRTGARGPAEVPGVAHILAVASGKGGVGKSTVATNLALALAANGKRVGLMDCDVYGPSVALMLGLHQRPESTEDKRMIPVERFGVKIMSFGSFIDPGTPVIWRGPMINKLLTQFLREVEWGELDYLVLDLPPGTGDAQLTITQQVPLAGGVIVTTPQDVALLDVKRGIEMFRQVHAPVLGVIENMSFHLCTGCGHRAEPFGHGGGARMASELGIEFLGELPLVRELREAADNGTPLVVAHPDHAQSLALRRIAARVDAIVASQPTEAAVQVF